MKQSFTHLLVVTVLVSILISGCSQAAPPPAPTQASAAAPKAAEPTKAQVAPTAAPAAQPTAAPAQKVAFPEKGRTITIVVPYAAGGGVDTMARAVAPVLEKDLGVPVAVLNKDGASGLIALTEVARAKPDGYTVLLGDLPTIPVVMQDPEMKATVSRKDLQAVANLDLHSSMFYVSSKSPYKNLKDIVDALKAKPESVKYGTSGMLSSNAFPGYFLQEAAGVKFAFVNFTGTSGINTALLGGNIDVMSSSASSGMAQIKAGTMRAIAATGKEENEYFPGVKTIQAQGFNVSQYISYGAFAGAGTPKEIVDILSGSMKKAMDDPAIKKKLDDLYLAPRYMNAAEYSAYWDQVEADARKVISLVRSKQ